MLLQNSNKLNFNVLPIFKQLFFFKQTLLFHQILRLIAYSVLEA